MISNDFKIDSNLREDINELNKHLQLDKNKKIMINSTSEIENPDNENAETEKGVKKLTRIKRK